jgi:L-threonylcarbamoyladenylate synthase
MKSVETQCCLGWKHGEINYSAVAQARELLKRGDVISLPTETVYGLCADALNDRAVSQIYAIKRRPLGHPLIIHVSTIHDLEYFADFTSSHLADQAQQLLEKFSPGPLTVVLPRQKDVACIASGGQATVALRMVDHPIFQAVVRDFKGLAAPSANRFGRISPSRAQHVWNDLQGDIPLIVDGGDCAEGLESTIVHLRAQAPPIIMRPGPIGKSALEACLGHEFETLAGVIPELERNLPAPASAHGMQWQDLPAVPGNVRKHYAPQKPFRAIAIHHMDRALHDHAMQSSFQVGLIATEQALQSMQLPLAIKPRPMPNSPADYGKVLYEAMRELDRSSVAEIWWSAPPEFEAEAWAAVRDRVSRALSTE